MTTVFRGKKVYQRNDIDPNKTDELGYTNLARMKRGNAPIGDDGEEIVLHHIGQQEVGPMVEVQSSIHQKGYSVLHMNTGSSSSQINRSAFKTWKRNYWKMRAGELE